MMKNKEFTIIDLIHSIETIAQNYRNKAIKSIQSNKHLYEITDHDLITQDYVDAILADFVNEVANSYGVNYGCHSYDIYWKDALKEFKKIDDNRFKMECREYEKKLKAWDKKRLKMKNKTN